jgi:8-oxo-dGTP diphosphatase
MKKRVSSRAVIIENDAIITIYRRKIKDDGTIREYYAIPGGGLEENESLEENVIRETKEELNVDVQILGYLGKEEDDNGITHFFHCEIIKGNPQLGGPEAKKLSDKNYFEIKYIKLNQIYDVDIFYRNIIEKANNAEYSNIKVLSNNTKGNR